MVSTRSLEDQILTESKRNSLDFVVDKANDQRFSAFQPQNWYKVFPFEIRVKDTEDSNGSDYVFALPIPPEAINIGSIVASEATATLGGVVEETSQNVFWTISLQGTMGVAISRPTDNGSFDTANPASKASQFRSIVNGAGMLSGVLESLSDTIQSGADILESFGSGDVLGGLNSALNNKQWFKRSAVSDKSNGYTEMLLLHQFLHAYSKAKEEEPSRYELYFVHHKQNIQWRVVLKDFQIRQSRDSPMMLKYSISFKGWDAKNPSLQAKAIDRFAPEGDLYVANTLTVTGVISSTRKILNTIRRGPPAIVDALITKRSGVF